MATDTSMALPLIRHNLSLNPNVAENVHIAELEWYFFSPLFLALILLLNFLFLLFFFQTNNLIGMMHRSI